MKIKASEATGPVLDWAVAKAEGYDEGWLTRQMGNPNPHTRAIPAFSTDWAQGGPIVEREKVNVIVSPHGTVWSAYTWSDVDPQPHRTGPTPLIAAMRCFVANKLGDEVDVPEALL